MKNDRLKDDEKVFAIESLYSDKSNHGTKDSFVPMFTVRAWRFNNVLETEILGSTCTLEEARQLIPDFAIQDPRVTPEDYGSNVVEVYIDPDIPNYYIYRNGEWYAIPPKNAVERELLTQLGITQNVIDQYVKRQAVSRERILKEHTAWYDSK